MSKDGDRNKDRNKDGGEDTPEPELPIRLDRYRGQEVRVDDLAPDIRELAKKPGRVMCGDIDMRIDQHGNWFYRGSVIGRPEMVKLFSSVLYRDEYGCFWMITPAEMARIHVADAPFTAVELLTQGVDRPTRDDGAEPVIRFRTNVNDIITLDEEHPLRVTQDPVSDEPRPYVTVRPGLDALIVRPVFYQLVEYGCEITMRGRPVLGVWSSGTFFPMGSTWDQRQQARRHDPC